MKSKVLFKSNTTQSLSCWLGDCGITTRGRSVVALPKYSSGMFKVILHFLEMFLFGHEMPKLTISCLFQFRHDKLDLSMWLSQWQSLWQSHTTPPFGLKVFCLSKFFKVKPSSFLAFVLVSKFIKISASSFAKILKIGLKCSRRTSTDQASAVRLQLWWLKEMPAFYVHMPLWHHWFLAMLKIQESCLC